MMDEDALPETIQALVERIRTLETAQRAEVAGGVESVTVAVLPTAGQTGRLRFATDGRKIGEGIGAGTGVLAYDDGVAWRRTSDDSTVVA